MPRPKDDKNSTCKWQKFVPEALHLFRCPEEEGETSAGNPEERIGAKEGFSHWPQNLPGPSEQEIKDAQLEVHPSKENDKEAVQEQMLQNRKLSAEDQWRHDQHCMLKAHERFDRPPSLFNRFKTFAFSRFNSRWGGQPSRIEGFEPPTPSDASSSQRQEISTDQSSDSSTTLLVKKGGANDEGRYCVVM